ncbi:MAG TPA: glycosyltransferase [Chitinophagaceae bacterium]|nr:glycosyltransferase [Chitinophagaceae bacterium]
MHQQPLLSIIIVNYNVEQFICLCLDSVIRAIESLNAEIIVVDNASKDKSVSLIKLHFPQVQLIESKENLGFSKANNLAYSKAKGKYIHFLNPDTVLPEDYYEKLIPFMEETPNVGAVGPRIIDGKGRYAPDSKKAFPSFWVSVSKVLGLSSLFPKSHFFNKYYAADIDEFEIAPVAILSGSTLLIPKNVIDISGGAFDESYFMYCEDLDLCYRIQQAGFNNYYVPITSMVHYKGESTKKLSYSYMKIFYQAHALFVKKYYPKTLGFLYNSALKIVLAFRNLFHFSKSVFSLIKLFILDGLLLTLSFIYLFSFWFDAIVQIPALPINEVYPLLLVFLPIWLLSLFFNGAYDKPYSLYKAGRGMIVGSVLVLATYSLFPFNIRFSRGAVVLSSIIGTIIILLMRWLLAKFKWIHLVPRGKLDYSVALLSRKDRYDTNLQVLKKNQFQSHLLGFISPENENFESSEECIGTIKELNQIAQAFHIDEIIFDTYSLSYKDILNQMEENAGKMFYNIFLPKQNFFVGSYYDKYPLAFYQLHQKYPIGNKSIKRNKALLDIVLALTVFFLSPFLIWMYENKNQFFKNIKDVILRRKTWVGYPLIAQERYGMPRIKDPILPPYSLNSVKNNEHIHLLLLYKIYAETYTILDDLKFFLWNIKSLDVDYFKKHKQHPK